MPDDAIHRRTVLRPLAEEAVRILVNELTLHDNILSELHRAALLELVDTFTQYLYGNACGRKAFALPTGMG
jgi:hypothetical protein